MTLHLDYYVSGIGARRCDEEAIEVALSIGGAQPREALIRRAYQLRFGIVPEKARGDHHRTSPSSTSNPEHPMPDIKKPVRIPRNLVAGRDAVELSNGEIRTVMHYCANGDLIIEGFSPGGLRPSGHSWASAPSRHPYAVRIHRNYRPAAPRLTATSDGVDPLTAGKHFHELARAIFTRPNLELLAEGLKRLLTATPKRRAELQHLTPEGLKQLRQHRDRTNRLLQQLQQHLGHGT